MRERRRADRLTPGRRALSYDRGMRSLLALVLLCAPAGAGVVLSPLQFPQLYGLQSGEETRLRSAAKVAALAALLKVDEVKDYPCSIATPRLAQDGTVVFTCTKAAKVVLAERDLAGTSFSALRVGDAAYLVYSPLVPRDAKLLKDLGEALVTPEEFSKALAEAIRRAELAAEERHLQQQRDDAERALQPERDAVESLKSRIFRD